MYGAIIHTLSRLKERYGVSAGFDAYYNLLERAKRALKDKYGGTLPSGREVIDVEFPGPTVRVVFDGADNVILTVLPPFEDEGAVSVGDRSMLELIGYVFGPEPAGSGSVERCIREIEMNLPWVRETLPLSKTAARSAGGIGAETLAAAASVRLARLYELSEWHRSEGERHRLAKAQVTTLGPSGPRVVTKHPHEGSI